MATAIMTALSSAFLPSQLTNSRRCFFNAYYTQPIKQRIFAPKIRASTTASVETKPADPVLVEKEVSTNKNIFACPVCCEPLSLIGDRVLSVDSAGSSLQCGCCKKTYYGKETHLELTVSGGSSKYDDSMPLATEMFRLPLISFLYERGWRQNFIWGGFPGPKKEFELMKGYLKPVLGGNIIDASCGSGLFSRLFAKSGLFSLVVALDYSENMLQQCYQFITQEENFPKENLMLVRADISRLPFLSGSVDAVHAGAAIHCWPSPSAANMTQLVGNQLFFHERELEDICRACGLVGFTAIRNRRFVMFSARKPS
ncbi:hypothetical protein MANES_18G068300v8 [Manihot esculenta]|uniref:Uncharacterized protein n=1 Tax=Manihot esculenta TaxID=3983 RepID=A0ACB7FYA5_MANES|nr:hypothetical protein MANES_18G068300v8 [Manihot esculenta]